MGTNSAMMAKRVIDNSFQVMAVLMMAVCQAIDLLPEGERERLSPKTKKLHAYIRTKAAYIGDDLPQFENISAVCNLIKENNFKS
jgi:histidine ammonia-lyase